VPALTTEAAAVYFNAAHRTTLNENKIPHQHAMNGDHQLRNTIANQAAL
jgi:hypothetical protein